MQSSVVILILKALLTLIPLVVSAVRDGRIREGAKEEVINALIIEHSDRVRRARDARDRVSDDGAAGPDPYDRATGSDS